MTIATAPSTATARYTRVAMWLHWIIAVLIVANLAIGLLHDPVPAFRALMPAHKAIGITVLVLTLVRIGWRLGHRAPPPVATMPRWQIVLAEAVHGLLYLLLLAMPLTGWAMVSGEHRRPLSWFGAFPLPYLPVSSGTADTAGNAHGLLGWLMLGLVALHVAAALYHRVVLHDGVLGRMRRRWSGRPPVFPFCNPLVKKTLRGLNQSPA